MAKSTFTVLVAQILLSLGCAKTYVFDIERLRGVDAIETPATVDFVAIVEEDLSRDGSLRRITGNEWFAFKRDHGHPKIDERRVVSVSDIREDMVTRAHVRHPDPAAWSAAVYLFAEVPGADDALIPRHQYRLTQLPPRGGRYTVRLEGDRMSVIRGRYRGPKEIVKAP